MIPGKILAVSKGIHYPDSKEDLRQYGYVDIWFVNTTILPRIFFWDREMGLL
jgi:hypothetical protein